MERVESGKKSHSVTIKEETTVGGITQVISVGEKEIRLAVGERLLTLTGNDFRAEKLSLDEGIMVIKGEVTSLKYGSKTEAKGILKKLFK